MQRVISVLSGGYRRVPPNKSLERTVGDKVPEAKRGRAAAQLRRYAIPKRSQP